MATIYKRTDTLIETWRMQIRRKGIPVLTLTFSTLEEAEEWVRENEKKYVLHPEKYLEWAEKERLRTKREREFARK